MKGNTQGEPDLPPPTVTQLEVVLTNEGCLTVVGLTLGCGPSVVVRSAISSGLLEEGLTVGGGLVDEGLTIASIPNNLDYLIIK